MSAQRDSLNPAPDTLNELSGSKGDISGIEIREKIMNSELPIFEVYAGLNDDGQNPSSERFRIYLDGHVEGFKERVGIVNHYPSILWGAQIMGQSSS